MTSPTGTKIMDNRDAIAAGMAELLRPAVQEVDERVRVVRESQVELRQRIEELDDALRELCKEKSAPIDLDLYVKKLANCKRRIATVNNIVQNAQDRVMKLDDKVNTTTRKRYRLMTRLRDKLSFESNPEPEAAIDVAHDKPLDGGQEDTSQEDARPDVETESREEESSSEK
ncbi:SNARE-associated protein Snapin [Strongylocentrotus purpuratus]|uniref:Biogenesis of lysosome-related organelles complex 1 subunit 7 n=1 Tax=Strongylocentrotus purpuratus TaxID=7668 RepID=A0A7M7GMB4_STRPU|nr:SNARE-associated protein Snapin [Strongylocentrotus purpuratus]